MTTVRIAHAEPRPGRQADGRFMINSFLVVLASDASGRALPIWLRGPEAHGLWRILDPSAGPAIALGAAEELAVQLLRAADVEVTAVEIDELDQALTTPPPAMRPGMPAGPQAMARIEVTGADGSRHTVATHLGYALALAAGSGAPVRVSDAEMDRLGRQVRGDDMLSPFLEGMPSQLQPQPAIEPRFEPRNLSFADGLAGWEFGGSFRTDADASHWGDYFCASDDGSALLASAVPEPYGFAGLTQTIFAEAYEGRRVMFRAGVRTVDVAAGGGLQLLAGIPLGPVSPPGSLTVALTGSRDWARHELAAEVPCEAGIIQFGIFVRGSGRVELRNVELSVEARP